MQSQHSSDGSVVCWLSHLHLPKAAAECVLAIALTFCWVKSALCAVLDIPAGLLQRPAWWSRPDICEVKTRQLPQGGGLLRGPACSREVNVPARRAPAPVTAWTCNLQQASLVMARGWPWEASLHGGSWGPRWDFALSVPRCDARPALCTGLTGSWATSVTVPAAHEARRLTGPSGMWGLCQGAMLDPAIMHCPDTTHEMQGLSPWGFEVGCQILPQSPDAFSTASITGSNKSAANQHATARTWRQYKRGTKLEPGQSSSLQAKSLQHGPRLYMFSSHVASSLWTAEMRSDAVTGTWRPYQLTERSEDSAANTGAAASHLSR